MMPIRLACAALPILIWSGAAGARDDTAMTACDTLLAARRVDAAAARETAPGPGCRRIARGDVGSVEQRAMIGGAPYECLTIAGLGRCLWVLP